ncbi:MAG: cytochrome c oxidase subunit 3 family protein [Bacteroidota bacterium]|nr:cytochrome c oxidase subunit 3 family protein [Bacteroidota bacterium]
MTEKPIHKTEPRDDFAAKMGMWLFIFTEMLLFAGLFLVYSVFRFQYPGYFHQGALELNVTIGSLNTVVLLISSMTVAMSLTALQKGDRRSALNLLLITILCAFIFLFNKYIEWGAKFKEGLYPGSALMLKLARGHLLFFNLYFFMTGLHALHIIVGMVILWIAVFRIKKGTVHAGKYMLLENGALYWHLVDLIWIFLFPLFYLIT